MQVPSGKVYNHFDLDILELQAKYGFIKRSDQPFTLKSGIQSFVYVFGREDLTDHPDLEVLIGRKIAGLVRETSLPGDKQHCLIGIPTAGTPFAQAAAMMSTINLIGQPICHRIMRETVKQHGVHRSWINGDPDSERHTYWWVDNVATNGDSKFEAAAKGIEQGYPERMPVLIWIDRQQGAVDRLMTAGFVRTVVAYNLLDITYAYGELGLWPKSAVKAVEEEIKAHQFLPKQAV